MATDDHVIGEVYYQLGLARAVKGGEPRPVVSAWRYEGIAKGSCNSRSCDVPFHFYCFTRFKQDAEAPDDAPERIHIPSKAHARMSMLTWRAFWESVIELGEDFKGWEYQDPEPDQND